MEIRVLGTVEAVAESGQSASFAGKSAIVLTLLALAKPSPIKKDVLHEVIWNGAGSTNVVESAIRAIRQKTPGTGTDVVVTRSSSYRLDAPTDVDLFSDLAAAGDLRVEGGDHMGALSVYEQALALWRGDLSRPANADQTIHLFESLDRRRRDVSLRRLRALAVLGRDDQILQDVGHLLAEDPFWEEVQAIRVGASYRYQGVHAAATIIRDVGKSFAAEGLTVSPEWNKLVTRILTHETESTPVSAELTPKRSESITQQRDRDSADSAIITVDRNLAYENLPPATYSKFVMRPDVWNRMEAAIVQDLPIISLIGVGGTGKSTLAREFGRRTVLENSQFAAVVWVSDKERPGTLTEESVIDAVAFTLEYQGITALEPQQKRREIIRIMRRLPTLLIIDNYESVKDVELARWLTKIPQPSKVLLTSIRRSGIPDQLSYEIKVDGLQQGEAIEFYAQCTQRMGLQEFVLGRSELIDLWEAADGNPRLIEWALGQVKRRGRQISDLVHEFSESAILNAAELGNEDVLITELFRTSWTGMSLAAKELLLAMTYLPYGAATETVKEISSHPSGHGDALQEISDLCFISRLSVPASTDSWHLVNPLVSSRRSSLHVTRMAEVQERWLAYWIAFAESMGFCPEDIDRLRKLDFEINRKNLEYAISWCIANQRYHEAIRITRGIRYFYYVRGLWSASPNPHLIRARAARAIGDAAEEFDALVYHFNILGKQESVTGTDAIQERLQHILEESPSAIGAAAQADYRHALALNLLAKGDFQAAEKAWQANLREPELLGPANYNANKRWYAICLKRMGRDRYEEARRLFTECREQAGALGHRRATMLIDLQTIELRLDTIGYLDEVPLVLNDLRSIAPTVAGLSDRRYEADHYWLLGRCHRRLGQIEEADIEFGKAAELYQRIGLISRADSARRERQG